MVLLRILPLCLALLLFHFLERRFGVFGLRLSKPRLFALLLHALTSRTGKLGGLPRAILVVVNHIHLLLQLEPVLYVALSEQGLVLGVLAQNKVLVSHAD